MIALLAALAMQTPQLSTVQFVTLVTGPSTVKLSNAEQARMQKQHLEGLEKLWKDGKALAVGPLVNAGNRRGIVVLDVPTADEARKLLADDPYVKSGHMAIETKPWMTMKQLMQKGPKFLDLQTVWLGYLTRPDDAPNVTAEEGQKLQAGHMANMDVMAASGDLALAGPMAEAGALRGLWVFLTPDEKRVRELAAKDPALARGRLKLELVRWMVAKGTFVPVAK